MPAFPVQETYVTHDNGGRPFMVIRQNQEIVDVHLVGNDGAAYGDEEQGELLCNYAEVTQFFAGDDPVCDERGNSVLFRVARQNGAHHYVYVGSEIYTFSSEEPVTSYVSPLGNSDVPYPYAVTASRTYLMIENVYVNNDDLLRQSPLAAEYTNEDEPYGQYYGHTVDEAGRPPGHTFQRECIHPRRW